MASNPWQTGSFKHAQFGPQLKGLQVSQFIVRLWTALFLTLAVGCRSEPTEPRVASELPLAPLLSTGDEVSPEYKDQYIVVLREDRVSTRAAAEAIGRQFSTRLGHVYGAALKGFSATLDSVQLAALRQDPRVKYVQHDAQGEDAATDTNAGWGLGRIDQRSGPSNYQFTSSYTGQGVNIYIVDGGVNTGHTDFGGRATAAATWDAAYPANQDCTGHGTQLASVAAGTEFGVAKAASVRSVRVNGCESGGNFSDWIWGIDWVAANRQTPAIMSFSKNGGDAFGGALDDAVRGAKNAGVFVVVAAGNKNDDACGYSPSEVLEVMVVGATDNNDARALYSDPQEPGSNYGSCVDLFAPGKDLNVALANGGYGLASGTSVAAPMVAGVAALLYQQYPTDTPDMIHYAIRDGATSGAVSNPGASSPNLLLFSTLPVPVSVSITGPASIGKFASCQWTAIAKGGRAPFTYSWTGILSGSNNAVIGNPPASGSLSVQVTDALGGNSSSSLYVTETTSMGIFCS